MAPCKGAGAGGSKRLTPAANPFHVESIGGNMKVPSAGGMVGGTTPGGVQNSPPRRSPELLVYFFSDKSGMAKRMELVLGPGDFEKHSFRAILGTPKKKNHTF